MAAGGKKFSWTRLITNMVPNFAHDDIHDVNLTPEQADNLFKYQLQFHSPCYLNELACFVTGIVGAKSLSKKVYQSLVKNDIILPVPEAGSGQDSVQVTVNSACITKHFSNQLAVISIHDQRKVVGLLFFWEEECMRWKLLDAEEKEILGAMETENGRENRDLEVALQAVE